MHCAFSYLKKYKEVDQLSYGLKQWILWLLTEPLEIFNLVFCFLISFGFCYFLNN